MLKKLFGAVLVLVVGATSQAALTSQTVASGFSLPVLMIPDPTNPNVLFVVQQRGRIKVVQNGVITGDFLSLVGTVNSTGSERGLLGMTFDPNYANNRYFYVNYTAASGGATRIVRYQRNAINPLVADIGSAFNIITIAQPFQNHNGGTIRFGADNLLYIGMGDGGDANDPGNRAQNLSNLLGKMLRLDVGGDDYPADANKNYRIPAGNPYAGGGGAPEIWSIGLRNPWKFTFDYATMSGTGGMLIGDVGQDQWEEVSYEPAGAAGRNYGWREWEGFANTGLGGGSGLPHRQPIYVYSHSVGQSITGGYVYRGTRTPELYGRYTFADFVQGKIFSGLVQRDGSGEGTGLASVLEHTTALGTAGQNISSIDLDRNGELYYLTYAGELRRVVATNAYWLTDLTPRISSPISGALRNAVATDGFTVTMLPQEAQDLLEENQSQAVFGLATDLTNTNLVIRVDARANQAGGKLSVELRNWTSGKFVSVGTYGLSATNQSFGPITVPASAYRRTSDKRIEILLKTYYMGIPTVQPHTVYVDRVNVQ